MTTDSRADPVEERQELSLDAAASHLLEECRTVVPGMQALFGFQLIAVFSTGFREQLVIAGGRGIAMGVAGFLLVVFVVAWVVVPQTSRRAGSR